VDAEHLQIKSSRNPAPRQGVWKTGDRRNEVRTKWRTGMDPCEMEVAVMGSRAKLRTKEGEN